MQVDETCSKPINHKEEFHKSILAEIGRLETRFLERENDFFSYFEEQKSFFEDVQTEMLAEMSIIRKEQCARTQYLEVLSEMKNVNALVKSYSAFTIKSFEENFSHFKTYSIYSYEEGLMEVKKSLVALTKRLRDINERFGTNEKLNIPGPKAVLSQDNFLSEKEETPIPYLFVTTALLLLSISNLIFLISCAFLGPLFFKQRRFSATELYRAAQQSALKSADN